MFIIKFRVCGGGGLTNSNLRATLTQLSKVSFYWFTVSFFSMLIPRKLKSMQREAHFCVVAWVCVLSSLVSHRAPRPKVPDSVHKGKELSFVLRSDGMADSSQLPCTCHWLSVSQGQILLSVSTVRRTLQRVFLGWAGGTISDAMKHAVTELVSCHP